MRPGRRAARPSLRPGSIAAANRQRLPAALTAPGSTAPACSQRRCAGRHCRPCVLPPAGHARRASVRSVAVRGVAPCPAARMSGAGGRVPGALWAAQGRVRGCCHYVAKRQVSCGGHGVPHAPCNLPPGLYGTDDTSYDTCGCACRAMNALLQHAALMLRPRRCTPNLPLHVTPGRLTHPTPPHPTLPALQASLPSLPSMPPKPHQAFSSLLPAPPRPR